MTNKKTDTAPETDTILTPECSDDDLVGQDPKPIQELNGPKGPEPTRFGDWERKGRCVDF